MTTWIRRTILIAGVATALVMVIGFFGTVSPYADTAAQFRLHVAWLLAAIAVVLIGLGPRLAGLLLAGAGIAGIALTLAEVGSFTPLNEAPDGISLRLYSLNLLHARKDTTAVAQQIDAEAPDVVVLVEVSATNRGILADLAPAYRPAVACNSRYRGLTILVSERINSPAPGTCNLANSAASVRVEFEGQSLTIVGLHLRWPAPFGQPGQVGALEPALADLPRPVLVAGDFNAQPWGQAVARVAAATDTARVPGYRPTWPDGGNAGGLAASLTKRIGFGIDHVLVPPEVAVVSVRTLGPVGSDHRPLLTDLVFF